MHCEHVDDPARLRSALWRNRLVPHSIGGAEMAGNGRKPVWHQNDRVVDTGITGMRKLKGGSGDACPTTLTALYVRIWG